MPLCLPKTLFFGVFFFVLVTLSNALSQQYGKQIKVEKVESLICSYQILAYENVILSDTPWYQAAVNIL